MRIIVLNLKKLRGWKEVFKPLVALVLLLSFSIMSFNFYVSSEAYVDAMIEESERKTVIIDAGHGGEDCGAIGVTGVYEKDLNLEIAFILGELLSKEGFAVIYTRTEDKLLYTEEENIHGIRKISDLKNRCKIAAENPNAIFISIHMNSYSKSKYNGLQVYYSPESQESERLALFVQSSVKKAAQPTNNRKTKRGEGIYVLENMTNTSILIECGFLTNAEECQKLSEKEYQKSLCFAILCGIIEYTNDN